MSNPVNLQMSVLNHPLVLLLRLALLVPLIGIWLFDPGGIQTWATTSGTILGTDRANGLLALSLIGEVGAILASFSIFAEPRRPAYLVMNIAILVASVASYFWGFFVGLWMGVEPSTAMALTVTILILAAVVRVAVRLANRL